MRNQNVLYKIHAEEFFKTYEDMDFLASILPYENIKFSKHAIAQMTERKICASVEWIAKNIHCTNVVDVQVEKGNKVKFLLRFQYSPKKDIVVAIAKNGIICTVWTNWKNDTHKTLKDKHLYTTNIGKLKQLLK